MAVAVTNRRRFGRHYRDPLHEVAVGPEARVRPLGAPLAGLAAMAVGVWAAIAVFIGPYFDYTPTSTTTWEWTTRNWMLHLVPGLVAVGAGLMITSFSAVRSRLLNFGMIIPALALIITGAWFVIGPAAWPVFESGSAYYPAMHTWEGFLNEVGTALGVGSLLLAFGGMALKAAVARPMIEPLAAPEAGAAGVAEAGTDTVVPADTRPGARREV